MTATSSSPSRGSATPISEPPPNAPVQAITTCHALPAKSARPSQATAHSIGSAHSPARSAPTE